MFRSPSGSGPIDPYSKYRIEPVGERQSKSQMPEPPDDDKQPKEKVKFVSYVLSLFQKAVDFFLEEHHSSTASEGTLRHLLALKTSFEVLKKEDRSQDVKFLNDLSNNWIALLEENLHFENDEIDSKFRLLMRKILSYPEQPKHSFGYYLTEYAGQKWVPFPYMELIQKIHREHEKNPTGSALTEWNLLLSRIISLLK